MKDQEHFSPDGRWIAFNADDSGRFEIYVIAFPVPGRPIQVSTNGGVQPRWRRDGKEMFYLALDGKMMSLEVRSSSTSPIEFGSQKALFETPLRFS
ncbi:MAG TPA: hypothetical protein VKK06_12200 [Terriglobia bacterium]|nr:hypothetical protein [Terriglobia bacterium]